MRKEEEKGGDGITRTTLESTINEAIKGIK
jgi:hypothetical protein